MKIKMGTTPVNVAYSDVELREKVLAAIPAGIEGVGFRTICDTILNDAEAEGKLGIPAGEQYQWMALSREDIVRIDRILCQALTDGTLIKDFDTAHYNTADTYFIRLQ